MAVTHVFLKDGTSISVNPLNPRECHTIRRGLFGVKVRCAATGAVRRIPWRKVRGTRDLPATSSMRSNH